MIHEFKSNLVNLSYSIGSNTVLYAYCLLRVDIKCSHHTQIKWQTEVIDMKNYLGCTTGLEKIPERKR